MARILLHSLIFSPDGVSTAYLMTDLAQELEQLGHEVTVLSTTPHYNLVESEIARQPLTKVSEGLFISRLGNIQIWHVQMGGRTASLRVRSMGFLRFHLRSLLWAYRRQDVFDVVISPSPPLSIGLVAWLIARRLRSACVYNVQELYPDFAVHSGFIKNSLAIWLLKKLEHLVYSKSDAIVTIAERFTSIVASRCSRPEKVRTIPNFVDTELYRPLPRENDFAREHELIDDFVVMYAGNIGLAQDWGSLLYAAEYLRDHPIKFVIIGDGIQKPWLMQTVEERQFKNILVLGYQARERMPEINASCDVATITMAPDAGRDGFPSKIYTTMACGKPSIVSTESESELAWIVRESMCGTVVPVGDNIGYAAAVMDAFQRRDALPLEGLRGRAFVEQKYSKKAVARQYESLIASLVR